MADILRPLTYTVTNGLKQFSSSIQVELYGTENLVHIKSTSDPYKIGGGYEKIDIIDHFFSIEQVKVLRDALNYVLQEAQEE